MNGLNTSNEDAVECPLCMEPLEVDDLNFYPCTCGYQICRFCWHRIRTDENKLCPACRKEYPENPADFTPLTQEEMIAFKSQKRQRDQQRKQKITENRKHLANVRVVQKNLVFVVGLPPRLADADILKKHEYFGKFGKIHKVVINPSTTYAGVQGPSASAYVTYVSNSDALRAIQSVNNIMIDGRLIKTSLGTTKYCSHFMKNQQCPKSDCMYLHELGDPDASFTKEEMHQGKHQEYEKRLHDALIASGGLNTNTSVTSSSSSGSTTATTTPTTIITNTTTTHNGVIAAATTNGKPNSTSSESVNKLVTSSSSASLPIATPTASVVQQSKEAWPSLSVSPVGLSSSVGKETTATTASTTTNTSANNNTNNISKSSSGSSSSRKDKTKHEKTKNEKNSSKSAVKSSQNGLKTTTSNSKNNNNNNNNTNNSRTTEVVVVRSTPAPPTTTTNTFDGEDQELVKTKSDKVAVKEKSAQNQRTRANQLKDEQEDSPNKKELRSIRSSSNSSSSSGSTSSSRSESTSSNSNDSIAELSESSVALTSGKCSPGDECVVTTKSDKHLYANEVDNDNVNDEDDDVNVVDADVDDVDVEDEDDVEDAKKLGETTTINIVSENLLNKHAEDSTSITSSGGRSDSSSNYESTKSISNNSSDESLFSQTKGIMDAQATLAKLSLFDDNNSFFSSSSATALQQSLSLKNKYDALESRANTNSSQLPDLLSG